MFTLKGRVAIVTGAAQGIGNVMAKMLATNGMNVAIIDVNLEKAKTAAAALDGKPAKVTAFGCDITDNASIADMVKAVAATFGQIDVVVNCAGIAATTKVQDVTRAEWDKMLAVNLGGTFFVTQAALPYLQKSKAGRVINIGSNAGRMGGYETSMAYTASKGGVLAITFGLARQFAPWNITVNAVCPSTVQTDMAQMFTPEAMATLKARIPLGRLCKPEDPAAAVCYLASEEAGFVTGLLLDVNGGMYMG